MSDEAWHAPFVRCLGVQLFGQSIDVDTHGETIRGDTMLLLFNADHTHKIFFNLPASGSPAPWELVFDTADWALSGSRGPSRNTNSTPVRWPSFVRSMNRSRVQPKLSEIYQRKAQMARGPQNRIAPRQFRGAYFWPITVAHRHGKLRDRGVGDFKGVRRRPGRRR